MTFHTATALRSLFFSCAFLLFSNSEVQGNLVVNGSFETGNFTGWSTQAQTIQGNWVVYSGTTLPLSSNNFIAPPNGTYAAAADESEPSSMILYQDIAIPSGLWTLQFTYYYHNYNSGGFVTPSPNSLNVGTMGIPPNQQFRFDIMDPTAPDPYSVNAPYVLQNLYQSQPSSIPPSQGPITVSYDISAFAGQTIRLRFAVTDNQLFLNLGIDGVAIIPGIPAPSDLKARKVNNRFLVQTYPVVQLTWGASDNDLVVGYHVYENGNFIGTVPASGPLVFNAPFYKKATIVYGVAAFETNGVESNKATVVFED